MASLTITVDDSYVDEIAEALGWTEGDSLTKAQRIKASLITFVRGKVLTRRTVILDQQQHQQNQAEIAAISIT